MDIQKMDDMTRRLLSVGFPELPRKKRAEKLPCPLRQRGTCRFFFRIHLQLQVLGPVTPFRVLAHLPGYLHVRAQVLDRVLGRLPVFELLIDQVVVHLLAVVGLVVRSREQVYQQRHAAARVLDQALQKKTDFLDPKMCQVILLQTC